MNSVATLVFDEKSMRLLSQSSIMNENKHIQTKNESDFEQWHAFASKHLKVRLVSRINWTNAACQTNNCSTGEIREGK